MNQSGDSRLIHATLAQMARLLAPWASQGDPQHPSDPRDLLRAWGTPVDVPQPWGSTSGKDGTPPPDDDGNAWGRQVNMQVGQAKGTHTAVQLKLPQAMEMDIVVSVTGFPNPNTVSLAAGGTQTFFPFLEIEWGNGSTSTSRTVRCDDYYDTNVAGNYLRVIPYFGDSTGTQIAASSLLSPTTAPTAQFAVFAVRRTRNGIRVPRWKTTIAQPLNAGVLFNVPCQIISLEGHLQATTAAPIYLQLFDQTTTPVNGNIPVYEFVVDSGVTRPRLLFDYLPPIPFAQGCSYGFSTTSGTLTLGPVGVVQIARWIL